MTLPLVSVIIATYNRAGYIIPAVESALGQTYRPIEIIVVDDGSTDHTRAVLVPYADRLTYIWQENQGEAAARNTAIQHSRGQYMAILDSDDLWLPNKLEKQIALLENLPEVVLVAAQALPIDGDGRLLAQRATFPAQPMGAVDIATILMDSPLVASTLVVRRHCLPKPLPFTPGLRYVDWEMCLRVASHGVIWFQPEILTHIRVHNQNDSYPLAGRQQIERRLAHRLDILDRVWPELPIPAGQREALRRQFEARELAETAIPGYVNDDLEIASQRLARALRLDPDTWQRGPALENLMLHYAGLVWRADGEAAAWTFLRRFMAHLPPELAQPERLRRRVYAQVHIFTLADALERQGDLGAVRRHLWAAVRLDPTQLANRGVLARLARSLGWRRANYAPPDVGTPGLES